MESASRLPHYLTISAIVVLFAGLVGFLSYSAICPCERTPGGFLFGDRVTQPVDNWYFANEVDLCQLQIFAGIRPHSINLNCMATDDGQLYVSCSYCERKYWAAQVDPGERATLRLAHQIYPVSLSRVLADEELDRAWRARVAKLQHVSEEVQVIPRPPADAPRPDHWWTFRVESRSR